MWLHGGGWETGDKALGPDDQMRTFNRVPRLLHADGWTVVSVNYRLSPEAQLEDMVDDFYAALVAVAQNAEAWNVDLDRSSWAASRPAPTSAGWAQRPSTTAPSTLPTACRPSGRSCPRTAT